MVLQNKLSRTANFVLDNLLKQITHFGDLAFYSLLAIVALLIEKFSLFWNLFFSLALIMPVAIAIRLLYFKERPDSAQNTQKNEKYKYNSILERIDASSFPSIHAMRAISLALILGNYFHRPALNILFALTAILVLISRVYLKRHYTKDVLFGALLGAAITLPVYILLVPLIL